MASILGPDDRPFVFQRGPGGPPPPPPPPPGDAVPPGGDYYSRLLSNDPQLKATLDALSALGDSYKTGFGTNIAQLLEQYGAVPDQVPDALKPYITDTVRDLANSATAGGASTLAQLTQAAKVAHEQSINSLAARGLIHSGALGQHENADLQSANLARSNALNSLLGNIGQAQQGFLGQQQSLEQQRETAANDALNRIYSQINAGTIAAPGSGTPTTPPPAPTPKVKPPASPTTLPYRPKPVGIAANPTGGSARAVGGIFSVH